MYRADSDLQTMLDGCRRGDRNSQGKLYEHFYGYAMSICLRYCAARESAVEILNEAFYKVLTRMDQYDPAQPFKPWLRRILIHAAVDALRRNNRILEFLDISEAADVPADDHPMPRLSADEDLLPALQQLPPAYRTVFNLYVIEEYSHAEIGTLLGISASASRSNLARACARLRQTLAPNSFKTIKTNGV